jgi:hypothetical protein
MPGYPTSTDGKPTAIIQAERPARVESGGPAFVRLPLTFDNARELTPQPGDNCSVYVFGTLGPTFRRRSSASEHRIAEARADWL